MTRKDFENGLIARLEDIKAFYREYNPQAFEEGNRVYLSMFFTNDTIVANNAYYDVSETNPDRKYPVNCWKTRNNSVRHADI